MFTAVALFVILLLGLLYIAFMRFGDPPPPSEAPPAVWAPPPAQEVDAETPLLALERAATPARFRGAGG